MSTLPLDHEREHLASPQSLTGQYGEDPAWKLAEALRARLGGAAADWLGIARESLADYETDRAFNVDSLLEATDIALAARDHFGMIGLPIDMFSALEPLRHSRSFFPARIETAMTKETIR